MDENLSYKKQWDAVTWLKSHPEDIPMAKENLMYRDKGFDNDDIRLLMAAICLRACIDYKNAFHSKSKDVENKAKAIQDCREFFGSDIFQFFVNGMPVPEIEKCIRRTPKSLIHNTWRKISEKEKKEGE